MDEQACGYDRELLFRVLIGRPIAGLAELFLNGHNAIEAIRWRIERGFGLPLTGISDFQIESGHPQFVARMHDYRLVEIHSRRPGKGHLLEEAITSVRNGGTAEMGEARYLAGVMRRDRETDVVSLALPKRLRNLSETSQGA